MPRGLKPNKLFPKPTWREWLLYRLIPYMVKLEGNKWDGKIHGLECMLRRNKRAMHWHAFVRVPDYHKYWGKDLDECYHMPQCIAPKGEKHKCVHRLSQIKGIHGGISYVGKLKNHEGWWIGIDFGHEGDLSPTTLKILGTEVGRMPPYRTLSYARTELEKLAAIVKQHSWNA